MSNFTPRQQNTLCQSTYFSGTGVHSGKLCRVSIHPAEINTGIEFQVLGPNKQILCTIPANFKNITTTQMATTLHYNGHSIQTVEHLLAALYGLEIDNARITVSGGEIPILDGSSQFFAQKIKDAGIQPQNHFCSFVRVLRTVEVSDADKFARVSPSEELSIQATVHWDHPVIGTQQFAYLHSAENFVEQLASARTFGFLEQVEQLKAKGLILGACLENAIVLNATEVISPHGLRYTDEFVRHKILDALGDFSLSGFSFLAHFTLFKAGHGLHQKLLTKLFSDPKNFSLHHAALLTEKTATYWSAQTG